jgi:hypothetical protein
MTKAILLERYGATTMALDLCCVFLYMFMAAWFAKSANIKRENAAEAYPCMCVATKMC